MTFARYIAVQLFAYGIDMGIFLALLNFVFEGPIISNVLGKIAAGVFAFLLHRSFTFRFERGKRGGRQVFRYFLLLGLNIPVSAAALGLLLLIIDIPVAAKFISDVICVLFSFWLSKIWVFSSDQHRIMLSADERGTS